MAKKKRFKIEQFELRSHGFDNDQCFQGCGQSNFKEVVTGCGPTEKAAFEDALEQIATKEPLDIDFTDIESGAGELSEEEYETKPLQLYDDEDGDGDDDGFSESEEEPHDMHYYYSIRYNV